MAQEIELQDASGDRVIVFAYGGYNPILEIDADDGGGVVALDRRNAMELAAILTHFADTGELPNDEEGGRDDN